MTVILCRVEIMAWTGRILRQAGGWTRCDVWSSLLLCNVYENLPFFQHGSEVGLILEVSPHTAFHQRPFTSLCLSSEALPDHLDDLASMSSFCFLLTWHHSPPASFTLSLVDSPPRAKRVCNKRRKQGSLLELWGRTCLERE